MICDLEKMEVPVLQICTQVLKTHDITLNCTGCSNYNNSCNWNIIFKTVHKQYTVIG